MSLINILPDSVANQIAAGEVVDRPASAVKELLENAIDAGATAIQLIVKDAGRTLIQVIDNGCGMSDTDARLCFERHATSKIHKADDLFAIRTMGFRGEALASIAAVAQVELKSRLHDSELGTQVVIEGSDLKEQCPCSCSAGTSIAVKNLFFNIPARRNFLKRDSIELNHIDEIFRRVALANYNIAFSFHHNGKLLYDLGSGNFAQRIAGIFGINYNQRLYHIEEQTQPVRLTGYVGKAEYAKRVRGEQYLFVNGRYIRHNGLSAAVERAYSELIPDRTYPAYFILLDVDPNRIDVNIHPTKTEVRFIDEQVIFAILRAATKRALGQYSLANELEFNPSTEIDFSPAPAGFTPEQPQVTINPHYNPFRGTMGGETKRESGRFEDKPMGSGEWNADNTEGKHGAMDTSRWASESEKKCIEDADFWSSDEAEKTEVKISNYETVCFLDRYIITTLKSGIAVIDRQRALERIFYERLLARRQNNACTSTQQLLFPVTCRFSSADSEILGELMPELNRLGFVISPLATNTYVVTACPSDIKENDIQTMLEQSISDFKSNMMQKFSERDKSVCLSLARQMAAAGDPLTPQAMQQLIADLFSCQAPDISPSGKRTMTVISQSDISERLK